MSINQEKGMVRDPMLETAYKDVEGLRDNLMQARKNISVLPCILQFTPRT